VERFGSNGILPDERVSFAMNVTMPHASIKTAIPAAIYTPTMNTSAVFRNYSIL